MGLWTRIMYFLRLFVESFEKPTKTYPTIPSRKMVLCGVIKPHQTPKVVIRKTWEFAMSKACAEGDDERLQGLVNIYGEIEEEVAARAVN